MTVMVIENRAQISCPQTSYVAYVLVITVPSRASSSSGFADVLLELMVYFLRARSLINTNTATVCNKSLAAIKSEQRMIKSSYLA